MKLTIKIECPACAASDTIPVDVPVTEHDKEKSMSDSVNKHSNLFTAEDNPQSITIKCISCGEYDDVY